MFMGVDCVCTATILLRLEFILLFMPMGRDDGTNHVSLSSASNLLINGIWSGITTTCSTIPLVLLKCGENPNDHVLPAVLPAPCNCCWRIEFIFEELGCIFFWTNHLSRQFKFKSVWEAQRLNRMNDWTVETPLFGEAQCIVSQNASTTDMKFKMNSINCVENRPSRWFKVRLKITALCHASNTLRKMKS